MARKRWTSWPNPLELVRHYTEHGGPYEMDYELEIPHLTPRIRAKELLQDTDESAYYEIDKKRPLSFEGLRATSF